MNKRLIPLAALVLASVSCADLGIFQRDSPEKATAEDHQEAEYIRNLLNSDPRNQGMFEVVPGLEVTTVRFTQPDAPDDDAVLRESMNAIRGEMYRDLGHRPNTLRFVFPKTTLEE